MEDDMDDELTSPRILKFSWGSLTVEGRERPYKDAKLYPGGSREWNWGETGTEHNPGIQPADVQELLERGARVIVLSQGVLGRPGVMPETLRLLEIRGVRVEVLNTREAVERYNQLAEGERVGALIHSTC